MTCAFASSNLLGYGAMTDNLESCLREANCHRQIRKSNKNIKQYPCYIFKLMFILNIFSRIFDVVFTFFEFLLSIRFILLMFKMSASTSWLVSWVYETSNPFVKPFSGIFQQLNLWGFVIDFTTLFALIAYGVLGMLVVKLISHPTSYN